MNVGGGDRGYKWRKWNLENIMVSNVKISCSMGGIASKSRTRIVYVKVEGPRIYFSRVFLLSGITMFVTRGTISVLAGVET